MTGNDRGDRTFDAELIAALRALLLVGIARVPGLDQLPEALLPLLLLKQLLEISMASVIGVALVFMVLDIVLAPLRHPTAKARNHERSGHTG